MNNSNTALQTAPQQAAAIVAAGQHFNFTADDIALIKNTVAKGASDAEFKLLLYQAQRYGLDPLVREIWCVKNSNQPDSPAQIFAGRDGFLAIAHRNPHFDGMDSDGIYNDKGELIGAVATVWRNDMAHPFTVRVRRDEYDTKRSNWVRMPETMLKKVAECQALRKAFNIHGLYDPDELRNGTAVQSSAPAEPKRPGPKTQEYNRMVEYLDGLGVSADDANALFGLHNKSSKGSKDMTLEEVKAVVQEVVTTYSTLSQVQGALEGDVETAEYTEI